MYFGREFEYGGKIYDIMSLNVDSRVGDEIRDKILRKMFDMRRNGSNSGRLREEGVEGLIRSKGFSVVGSAGGYYYTGRFDIENVNKPVDYSVMIIEEIDHTTN